MSARARRSRLGWWIAGITAYVTLLALSPAMRAARLPVDERPASSRNGVHLPTFTSEGPVAADRSVVSLSDWRAASERGLPVVFLHGAPGDGDNADALAPWLLAAGRRVVSPDLPGFGDSDRDLPDLGARAHARYVLALMDHLAIDRAHIVGWSNGGAVALNMADLAPDRTATITLLASVGAQETEGSGSYFVEHMKYRIGWWGLRTLQLATPHFGLLGNASDLDWLRNFDDTDQRPMADLMRRLGTPALILHGRHDLLTPAWGAERHHELMPASRLVMLEASHFIPFLQAEEAAGVLPPFFARHDEPGVAPLTGIDDRAPEPHRTGAAAAIEWVGVRAREVPWWVLLPLAAVLARWRPELATVLAGMYVGRGDIDVGVVLVGLFIGRLARPRTPFDGRRLPLGWIGTAAWTGLALLLVFIPEQGTFGINLGPDDLTLRWGLSGLLLWLIAGPIALHTLRNLPRRRGRQRLFAQGRRLIRHEYWPNWAIYLPIVPIWIGRLFKPGGILAFTAANPGIPCGGGFVGESKSLILRALEPDPRVLPHEPIEPGDPPAQRARRALQAIASRPELGGFPVVLKPDAGYRGIDVHLARDERSVHAYFERVRVRAIVQRFAPGPEEFGVMWIRHAATVHTPSEGEAAGEVYAVTDKVFSTVTGDGRRTLGALLLAHPRHRCQVRVFHARFGDRLREVPPAGQAVRLAQAGNHAQGTEFRDGTHLVTPALARAIDELAANFDGGFDFGRFDVRCPSREHFVRGEGLEIVELNGVTSEATNLYDPTRSVFWAWGVLRGQWKRLYAVADARIAQGAKPLGWVEFIRLLRHRRDATTVSD